MKTRQVIEEKIEEKIEELDRSLRNIDDDDMFKSTVSEINALTWVLNNKEEIG